MRRHWVWPVLVATGVIVLAGFPAFAQYRGVPPVADFGLFGGPARLPTGSEVFERVIIDVVAGVLGFLVGAFFSPLLRPFRRILFFGALAALTLYAWLGYAPIADGLTKLVAIFTFAVALGYGLRLGYRAFIAERNMAERPTSFGSAKWATFDYLRTHGLLNGKGFLLGSFREEDQQSLVHYDGARHLLTVAPTRSGKGVSAIIPNLLTYDASVFVIDPKGENALITAPRRGDGDPARGIVGLGQSVYLLDPWDIAASQLGMKAARFNPLDWIRADDPDASENAFLLAEALVPSGAEGEAKFWDEESKALLCGVILYVATSKHEADSRNLGRVRDILTLGDTEFKAVLENMYNEDNRVVASTASRTASKDPKLRSNVLAAVQSHTHFLDSARIRDNLSRSDFRFEDLKTKPMTVYLILPADRLETFGRWLRLLIQQAITVNARNIDAKPPKPVLFLLDEMPALGRLSMVEQAFGLMAGFGIQLWGIVQDLSQLERIYDKGWQTFISNSGVIQYFGSRDKITAEYFSTLCGVTTVRTTSISYALGRALSRTWGTVTGSSPGSNSTSTGGSDSTNHSHTIGSNESQRQLAYPDELMVLKNHQQIIFVENLDPIQGSKLRWFKNKELRALGVNLYSETDPPAIAAPPQKFETPRAQPAQIEATPADPAQPVNRLQDRFKQTVSDAVGSVVALLERKLTDTQTYGDTTYYFYSDGSIHMKSSSYDKEFASMDELQAFLKSFNEGRSGDQA